MVNLFKILIFVHVNAILNNDLHFEVDKAIYSDYMDTMMNL